MKLALEVIGGIVLVIAVLGGLVIAAITYRFSEDKENGTNPFE